MTYYGESRRSCCCADMDGNGYVDIVTTWMSFDPEYVPSILEKKFNDGQGNFVENPLSSTEELDDLPNDGIQCYPNPFSTRLSIYGFFNPSSMVEINIYNMMGQIVKQFTSAEYLPNKRNAMSWEWNGQDHTGVNCLPGIYFLQVRLNGQIVGTQKVIKR